MPCPAELADRLVTLPVHSFVTGAARQGIGRRFVDLESIGTSVGKRILKKFLELKV
jgi:hypothetical protein